MTPQEFAKGFIFEWEDGRSTDPKKTHSMTRSDGGNWSSGVMGVGKLIGSNHGVTALALAAYRKVPVEAITYDVMHNLKIEEAADIALSIYYKGFGLDKLPFDQVTASVFDMGWGSGIWGRKLLQRMIGVAEDGIIGPNTIKAYIAFVKKIGLETVAVMYKNRRYQYYEDTIKSKPHLAVNRNGWRRRTDSFLPGTPWWKLWTPKTKENK